MSEFNLSQGAGIMGFIDVWLTQPPLVQAVVLGAAIGLLCIVGIVILDGRSLPRRWVRRIRVQHELWPDGKPDHLPRPPAKLLRHVPLIQEQRDQEQRERQVFEAIASTRKVH